MHGNRLWSWVNSIIKSLLQILVWISTFVFMLNLSLFHKPFKITVVKFMGPTHPLSCTHLLERQLQFQARAYVKIVQYYCRFWSIHYNFNWTKFPGRLTLANKNGGRTLCLRRWLQGTRYFTHEKESITYSQNATKWKGITKQRRNSFACFNLVSALSL